MGCSGPIYGMVHVMLDGNTIVTVDASTLTPRGVIPDPDVGFCGQALYDSGILPRGQHTIEVAVGSTSSMHAPACCECGAGFGAAIIILPLKLLFQEYWQVIAYPRVRPV